MDLNKKAAITTCARAALSSLNKTLNREIVNTNNNCNLAASWCSGKTALLRRYFCLRLKGAGARVSLIHRGRSVRHERDRVVSDARITGGSPAQPAPGKVNSAHDCVTIVARAPGNGAPHSLSAPVGQGTRQAEGDCGRLMFKLAEGGMVPTGAVQKKPGRIRAPRQSYRQFNRQVTGRCDGLMKQRVVGGMVPTSTSCERGVVA